MIQLLMRAYAVMGFWGITNNLKHMTGMLLNVVVACVCVKWNFYSCGSIKNVILGGQDPTCPGWASQCLVTVCFLWIRAGGQVGREKKHLWMRDAKGRECVL